MKSVAEEIFSRHFNAKTVRSLAKRGITINSITAIPGTENSFSFCKTGYVLNDNGTAKVRTYLQVLELAK